MAAANPLVKIAMTVAGVGAGILAQKTITSTWEKVFDEDAPTTKNLKASAKATKSARKDAKKAGASKQEIAQITDPQLDSPVWKALLWAALMGAGIEAIRRAARAGAGRGTEKLIARRPRANRG